MKVEPAADAEFALVCRREFALSVSENGKTFASAIQVEAARDERTLRAFVAAWRSLFDALERCA